MMIKNKLIEEYLEYWMIKAIHCKDIENKNSAGKKGSQTYKHFLTTLLVN